MLSECGRDRAVVRAPCGRPPRLAARACRPRAPITCRPRRRRVLPPSGKPRRRSRANYTEEIRKTMRKKKIPKKSAALAAAAAVRGCAVRETYKDRVKFYNKKKTKKHESKIKKFVSTTPFSKRFRFRKGHYAENQTCALSRYLVRKWRL